MDETTPSDLPASAVRAVQIIASALILGILVFLGIVVYLVQTQAANPAAGSLLSYLSAGVFIVEGVVWFVLPSQLMNAQVKRIAAGTWTPAARGMTPQAFATDTAKLMAVYPVGNIIGWALLEGSAFLAIIAYLMEGKPLPLYVVGAVLLLMLQTFPTRNLIENWINRQKAVIEEIRSTTLPDQP